MTNVRFDKQLRWRPTAEWLNNQRGGRHYASDTHLITLALSEETVSAIQDVPYALHKRVLDCTVNIVAGGLYPEECNPHFAGYDYMRIYVHGLAAEDSPYTTLSSLLEQAPEQGIHRKHIHDLAPLQVLVPRVLKQTIQSAAAKKGLDLNSFLWEVLLDYAVEEL